LVPQTLDRNRGGDRRTEYRRGRGTRGLTSLGSASLGSASLSSASLSSARRERRKRTSGLGAIKFPVCKLPVCAPGPGAIVFQQHHADVGEATLNDRDQLFGIEVGKVAVDEQHLPVGFFQFCQRIGSSACLLHRPAAPVQSVDHLFPQAAIRARDQRRTRLREWRHGGKCTH